MQLQGLLRARAFQLELVAGSQLRANDDVERLQESVGSLGFKAQAGVAMHEDVASSRQPLRSVAAAFHVGRG